MKWYHVDVSKMLMVFACLTLLALFTFRGIGGMP